MFPKRYIYVLAIYVLFTLIAGGIIFPYALHYIFHINKASAATYGTTLTFAISLIVILILMRKDFKIEKKESDTSIGLLIGWIFIGIFLAFMAQIIAGLIETYAFKIEPGSENTFQIVAMIKMTPIFLIVPSIIGPILEELVFRKIIFGSLHKKMNFFFAAFISSVVFAAAHQDFSHLLIYTVMGLTFAFLYVQTKRIIVPIFVHVGMNTFVLLLQLLIDTEKLQQQLDKMQHGIITLLGG